MRLASRVAVPGRVDIIGFGLTLLDTDPDPDPECLDFDVDFDFDVDDFDSDYSGQGAIRLGDSDTEVRRASNGNVNEHQNQNNQDHHEFWESFDSLDHPTTSPPTPLSLSTHELDYDATSPTTGVGIQYTPEGSYEHLFKLDLKRYSFPSRQLRVARNVYTKGGPGGEIRAAEAGKLTSGIVDESDRDEIERFKREIQSHLTPGPPVPVPAPSVTPGPVRTTKRKQGPVTIPVPVHQAKDEDEGIRILPDLLWEEPDRPSTCLLDLDLAEMEPGSGSGSGSGARGGYKWKGPIRDIETGRPITPYRDDPSSTSNPASASSSQATRPMPRQTARRGRPFPSNPNSGPSRDSLPMQTQTQTQTQTHDQTHDQTEERGTSSATGSVASTYRRLGGMKKVEHKASTRSLPSKAQTQRNGPDGSHHHTSNSSAPPIPPSQSATTPAPASRNKTPKSTSTFTSTLSNRPDPTSPYAILLSKPQARRIIPPSLYSTATPLQQSMLRSWSSSCADKDYQNGVLTLLDWLTKSINLQYSRGGPRADGGRFKVDVFGSVSWGGETGTSGDLDMVVIDQDQMQGYTPDLWKVPPGQTPPKGKSAAYRPPSGLPPVYDLYKVTHMLKNMGMRDVMPIRGANTPIVKFTVADSGNTFKRLECDININDLGGWYNSSLILAYCDISPYVLRPLIHALKLWASSQDLNDPSGSKGPATMSSYCLTLMAIAYLQIRDHLPNLQAGINVPCPSYPTDKEDPDLVWVGWGKPQGTHAHVAFSRTPPKGWEPRDPALTAETALRGFFAYFGSRPLKRYAVKDTEDEDEDERFDREKLIVSILNGGTLRRAETMDSPNLLSKEEKMKKEPFMGKGDLGIQPSQWKEKLLVVQDPFIWQKSCTTAMHPKGLEKWFNAVDRADALFTTKGNKATLQDLLAPPPASSVQPSKNSRKKRTASGQSDAPAAEGQNRVDRYVDRMFGPGTAGGRVGTRGRGRGSVALSRRSASSRGGGGGGAGVGNGGGVSGGGALKLGGARVGDLVDL